MNPNHQNPAPIMALPDTRPVISGPLKSELKEIHPNDYRHILSQAHLLILKKAGVLTSAGWLRDPDLTDMRLAICAFPEWNWEEHNPVVRYGAWIALKHPLRDHEDIIIHGPFATNVTRAVIGLCSEIHMKNHIFGASEQQCRDSMDLMWLSHRILPALDGASSGATVLDMFPLLRAKRFDWVMSEIAICDQVGFDRRTSRVRCESRQLVW